jgi:hypothetical protein
MKRTELRVYDYEKWVILDLPQREMYSLVHNNHEKEKYSGFENSNAGPWFYIMYFA